MIHVVGDKCESIECCGMGLGFKAVIKMKDGTEFTIYNDVLYRIRNREEHIDAVDDVMEYAQDVEDGNWTSKYTPEQIREHADEIADDYIDAKNWDEHWWYEVERAVEGFPMPLEQKEE